MTTTITSHDPTDHAHTTRSGFVCGHQHNDPEGYGYIAGTHGERYSDIHIDADAGTFYGKEGIGITGGPVDFSASWPLFIIGEAWKVGVDFEDLADGFGAGLGTMNGDWSGIRDSSVEAIEAMLQRSLNRLFPGARR